jgi:predicted metal-dependent HD superfamily phosphohydrolase
MYETVKLYDMKLTKEQHVAIFFHDVIYQPGRTDNEINSTLVFRDWLFHQKAVDINSEIVSRIILDTKGETPSIDESKLVIDLDLYELSTDNYWSNYLAKIKKEYCEFYSEDQFREGRIKWLNAFLDRDKIYVSEWGEQFEKLARYNLEDELIRYKNEEI